MLGDAGQPQPVRLLDGELAADQVFLGGPVHQVAAALAPADALDAVLAHEPLDALAVHLDAQAKRHQIRRWIEAKRLAFLPLRCLPRGGRGSARLLRLP
jgi:hypothetical protein